MQSQERPGHWACGRAPLEWPSVGESTLIRSPIRLGGRAREGQPGLEGQHGQPDGEKDRADFSREKKKKTTSTKALRPKGAGPA